MGKSISSIYPNTKLSELIVSYPDMVTVLQRLGIAFGFGDSNIRTIAERHDINPQSFIAILQVFEGSITRDKILDREAIRDVLWFLQVSHRYFINKQVPDLKDSIVAFSETLSDKYCKIIISFFEGYIDELNEHFRYEDYEVFPYIENILIGELPAGKFRIADFEKNHTDIEQKLLDLKNILIKYIPEESASDQPVRIFRELVQLEQDLMYHSFIEDHLLIPTLKKMEEDFFN